MQFMNKIMMRMKPQCGKNLYYDHVTVIIEHVKAKRFSIDLIFLDNEEKLEYQQCKVEAN